MDYLLGLVKSLSGFDALAYIGAFVVMVNSMIAFCILIPGEQPEKFLQKVVDFVSKLSKK